MRIGKVLVVGAAEAGKSTLIKAISPTAMNLAVNGRTVAMDHATLERSGRRLSVVGVPGHRRFRVVREALAADAGAAIWVHRAGQPVDLETAGLATNLGEVPYVVFINHHRDTHTADGWIQPPAGPESYDFICCLSCRAVSSTSQLHCRCVNRVREIAHSSRWRGHSCLQSYRPRRGCHRD